MESIDLGFLEETDIQIKTEKDFDILYEMATKKCLRIEIDLYTLPEDLTKCDKWKLPPMLKEEVERMKKWRQNNKDIIELIKKENQSEATKAVPVKMTLEDRKHVANCVNYGHFDNATILDVDIQNPNDDTEISKNTFIYLLKERVNARG
ncbi:hypothetical protein EIN_322140 [Entamoeba invadens IP1]|uniref:Uncharacterized protein n=1 Tax=Entamoeba invadens IP1 TaxID=370355 RepID=A0A0A1UD38_ENTIV|nr:hypothetical protein EIN_322140 [Entamoeba invadens IP1]ELP93751.1 hypothetical protein EIN_322140 [Entamoeba invadens IP1]|eukprot:XP_004260522.1 hypothetical protein EIN_322140 [Entamoeba invadens IP1]